MILLWWTMAGMVGIGWAIQLVYRGFGDDPQAEEQVQFILRTKPVQAFLIIGVLGMIMGPLAILHLLWLNRRNLRVLFR